MKIRSDGKAVTLIFEHNDEIEQAVLALADRSARPLGNATPEQVELCRKMAYQLYQVRPLQVPA